MIELLGLLIFATIVGIGLLDVKSGLGPFAMYRSGTVTGVSRQERHVRRIGTTVVGEGSGQVDQAETPDPEIPEGRRGE